jgi:diguanylate cyclase (GGDEF)-like protein
MSNQGIPADSSKECTRDASTTAGSALQLRLDQFSRYGSLLVALIGAVVLCGWRFGIPALTRLLPGLAFMKVNTACGLLAAGTALWLLHTRSPGSLWIRFARVLAAVTAVIGVLTLSEHLLRLDLGIDQLIMADDQQPSLTEHRGRMSPAACFNFTFIGFALMVLRARLPRFAACTNWLLVAPVFVSALAVLGYIFGAKSLYEVMPFTSMAAHTALSFLILSVSMLVSDPGHGFARIATSDTAGGLLSRQLLPTLPIMIFVLGWACLEGQDHGLYDTHFDLALMVLLGSTVCIVSVARTAITLHRVDLTRRLAEAEIISVNAGLELRVQERTRELEQVSSRLTAVNGSLELLSRQDGLTGLANRRYFDAYLADQIAIARRYGRALSLVLFDVDFFKAYNDHYGHQAGDACLRQVADALRICCRRSADLAARYGGEEFAMILPETDVNDAVRIAESVRAAVAMLRIEHQRSLIAPCISISGGIAMLLDGSGDAQQMIMDADQSLYQAKLLGRNRILGAEPTIGESVATS